MLLLAIASSVAVAVVGSAARRRVASPSSPAVACAEFSFGGEPATVPRWVHNPVLLSVAVTVVVVGRRRSPVSSVAALVVARVARGWTVVVWDLLQPGRMDLHLCFAFECARWSRAGVRESLLSLSPFRLARPLAGLGLNHVSTAGESIPQVSHSDPTGIRARAGLPSATLSLASPSPPLSASLSHRPPSTMVSLTRIALWTPTDPLCLPRSPGRSPRHPL